MARRVSYSREDRKRAEDTGQELVTIDACGVTYNGVVSKEAANEVNEFFRAWHSREMKRVKRHTTTSTK